MSELAAARFEDFYGVDALIGRLKRGVKSGSATHAYLFCGPAGTGKRTLANLCARALNCESAGEKPCDVCGVCRRYLAGSHPDHLTIAREKNIKVEDVRDLIDFLSIRPYEGGRHTVIIERADTMTPQAQNALLKTLEEPPGDAVLFLLAEKAAPLLPTILSRVRLVRFAPLDDETCAQALVRRGIARERAGQLAMAAQGCVGTALRLDKDEAYWALRGRVTDSFRALASSGDVASAFEKIAPDKESAGEVLDIMEQIARCRMEEEEGLPARAEEIALDGARLLRDVLDARRALASNVNWQYAMEMLYFDLCEESHQL